MDESRSSQGKIGERRTPESRTVRPAGESEPGRSAMGWPSVVSSVDSAAVNVSRLEWVVRLKPLGKGRMEPDCLIKPRCSTTSSANGLESMDRTETEGDSGAK